MEEIRQSVSFVSVFNVTTQNFQIIDHRHQPTLFTMFFLNMDG